MSEIDDLERTAIYIPDLKRKRGRPRRLLGGVCPAGHKIEEGNVRMKRAANGISYPRCAICARAQNRRHRQKRYKRQLRLYTAAASIGGHASALHKKIAIARGELRAAGLWPDEVPL